MSPGAAAISSPVAGYTTGIADLARIDGSAWADEPQVLGGSIAIVDTDIPDTSTQRIVDLTQNLLHPLASTVQLANPSPLITTALAAIPTGA